MITRYVFLLAGSLLFTGSALAFPGGNTECPVDLVSGKTLDEEFGVGSQELTQCVKQRHHVKLLIQINNLCADTACSKAYALHNIVNVINDYEITAGMKRGLDYEIVAVVHSGGGPMLLKNGYTFVDSVKGTVTNSNPFEKDVVNLMNMGVRFLFCQNTTRGMISSGKLPDVAESTYGGGATEALIPGVEYVTAGIGAIADLQKQGYQYVQP